MPNDHDLLIRLDENVKNVGNEIRLLRDGAFERLNKVELGKLDKSTFDEFKKDISVTHKDHEDRMRKIERMIYLGIGGLAVIQILIGIFK